MSKLKLTVGQTSQTFSIFVQDSSSGVGEGLAGLVAASGGLIAANRIAGTAAWVAFTLQAAVLGTWTDRGFIEEDAVKAKGWYEIGVPNLAYATAGSRRVHFSFRGAVNMVPVAVEIELDAVNYQSNTGFVASVPLAVTLTNYSGNTPQSGDAFARIGANGAGLTALGDAHIALLDAAISTRSVYAGGAVASVAAAVTVGTITDKAGYSLSPTGLDAIAVTDPGGPAAMVTLPKMIVGLWRFFHKKRTMTSTLAKVYADDGVTANVTASVSDDGTTQTYGAGA